jgi:AraC-like DNA-binding protein
MRGVTIGLAKRVHEREVDCTRIKLSLVTSICTGSGSIRKQSLHRFTPTYGFLPFDGEPFPTSAGLIAIPARCDLLEKTDMPPFAKAAAGRSQAPESLPHLELGDEDDRSALANDPIVRHLRPCLQTARARPSESCSNCLDHLETVLQVYLRHTHNIIPLSLPVTRGGLAPWQLRRTKELMCSRLDQAVPLAELARAVNLSPGHFVRAFKQSTGQPPHRWLVERRIAKAKQLLVNTSLPLAEIALACGFSDQSHFSRVFSRATNTSPGAWRRYLRSHPSAQLAM